jgi:pimeloyl-ACP methyl ester carboxylesterase
MPWADASGLRIFYQTAPAPEGGTSTPVLFLHGLGSCAEDWALQVAALSAERTVITLDLPGHGQSGRLSGWPTIQDYAAASLAPLDVQGVERADVIGLSLGGLVALQLCLDHPERVRSLTLVNAFARMRVPWNGLPRILGRILLLLAGPMDWLGTWVAAGLFPHPDQEPLRRLAAERLASNSRRSYLQAAVAVARFDQRPALGGIRLPVQVIAGEQDRTVSLPAKRELAERIAGAQLTILPGSGHASPIDAPSAFNQVVRNFLREVDASAW